MPMPRVEEGELAGRVGLENGPDRRPARQERVVDLGLVVAGEERVDRLGARRRRERIVGERWSGSSGGTRCRGGSGGANRTRGLGAPFRVLPVVAAAMIERRVRAGRQAARRPSRRPRPRSECAPWRECRRGRSVRSTAGQVGQIDQRPRSDEFDRRGEIGRLLAIAIEMRHDGPDSRRRLADARAGRHALATGLAESQLERLRSAQQLDRQDRLDVRLDRPRVPGPDGAHRDVILLVGARRDRIDRRRMRQHLVLRHERRGGVLEQHHSRLDAAVRRQERRQAAGQPRVGQERRPPLRDRAELGDRDLRRNRAPARPARHGSCRR